MGGDGRRDGAVSDGGGPARAWPQLGAAVGAPRARVEQNDAKIAGERVRDGGQPAVGGAERQLGDSLLGKVRDRVIRPGRAELAAAMGSPPVVMGLVLGQDRPQVPLTEDEHPVGDLCPGGEHEPFRVSVRPRASRRDLHGLDADVRQDCVERPSELPSPVTDQEPEIRSAITQIHQEVAGLLCGPRPVRARSDTEDVHVPRAHLDHEEAVQALQCHRAVHVEEVDREHRGCLGMQELPPGRVGAPLRRRRDLQGLENPSDGGRADPVADLQQLTLDPLVAPAVVLGGEPLDQRGNLSAGRRPSRPARLGPLAGDQATVPAQEGTGVTSR